jgi:Cys-tRNA(Pro)/Cys-tRNA(Cys) deacylase
MTPAILLLKKRNISFELLQYNHDTNSNSYGLEVVEKLQLPAEQVFKTLIINTDIQQLVVAIVPVNKQLNLKNLAKILKVKKVTMADAKRVETSTGYILGGVSPLGQKKQLKTVIDNSANKFTIMYVSGGKRGLELALSPLELAKLTRATFADITNS